MGSVAVLTVIAGAAKAADLPPPAAQVYRPPPPAITYFTWTGCYLGGHVGGLWASRDWNDQIPGDPLFGTGLGSYNTSGALGGAQVGCNYQVGNWFRFSRRRCLVKREWQQHLRSFCHPGAFSHSHGSVAVAVAGFGYGPRRLCRGSLARLRQGRRCLAAKQLQPSCRRSYRRNSRRDAGWLDAGSRRRICLLGLAHRLRRIRLLQFHRQHEHVCLHNMRPVCRIGSVQHHDQCQCHQSRA